MRAAGRNGIDRAFGLVANRPVLAVRRGQDRARPATRTGPEVAADRNVPAIGRDDLLERPWVDVVVIDQLPRPTVDGRQGEPVEAQRASVADDHEPLRPARRAVEHRLGADPIRQRRLGPLDVGDRVRRGGHRWRGSCRVWPRGTPAPRDDKHRHDYRDEPASPVTRNRAVSCCWRWRANDDLAALIVTRPVRSNFAFTPRQGLDAAREGGTLAPET